MRTVGFGVAILLTLPLGCATRPPVNPSPALLPPGEDRGGAPFEAIHPLRGPGLHLDGLRLVGGPGAFQLMIGAFDDGRDIVFFMRRSRETPATWLDACPRSTDDPRIPRLVVALQGVGDLSRDSVYETADHWWTSVPVDAYARLRTLRFEVCGTPYAVSPMHDQRIALHARLALGRATRKNQEEGALPQACAAGDGPACTRWGALERDPREARQKFERACTLRDGDGCRRFAGMLSQGRGGAADPARALSLFQQGCAAGDDFACLEASRAVIQRPSAWPAPGAEGRYQEGARLARRACELGGTTQSVSCLRAAKLHASGFGLPADPALVASFVERACQNDFKAACRLRQALPACAKGSGEACAAIADAERRARYRGLKDDGREALWRQAACRHGHAPSCAAPAR